MKLKIGLFGAGHLGKIHINCIQLASDFFDLVGFFDPDDLNAGAAEKKFNVRRYQDPEKLMDDVDVIDIVTPTPEHFSIAKAAIQRKKHVFIEKPITHTLDEAEELIALSSSAEIKIQVGHVERFNPALLSLGNLPLEPMFIEGHRLANFNPRGTDVPVILDLMIHDLDIVLNLVKSKLKNISASGVSVVSETPDIANARLEFENGCVANLTASRISMKQMRKIRLFQRDAYISLNFLDKSAQVIRMYDQENYRSHSSLNSFEMETPTGKKWIEINSPDIEPVNAIRLELETFAKSILENQPTKVSIIDGYMALKVAYDIMREIENRNIR